MHDPIELEVFKNLYHSIAEEMGARTAPNFLSPNIKERRDYSCAVFDSSGQVIRMGDHMPCILAPCRCPSRPRSSMPAGTRDIVMLNDPFRAVPTFLTSTCHAVYVQKIKDSGGGRVRQPQGRISTLHRALTMPTLADLSRLDGPCREIYQEGFRIPPVKIMRRGKDRRRCAGRCS